MALAPHGMLLDPGTDSVLIDSPSDRAPPRTDGESARIASMYAAAVAAHLQAILNPSACDEFECAESMRVLTSMAPGYKLDRQFLSDSAGLDAEKVRLRALELIADADQRARCLTSLRGMNKSHQHPNRYNRANTAVPSACR